MRGEAPHHFRRSADGRHIDPVYVEHSVDQDGHGAPDVGSLIAAVQDEGYEAEAAQ